MALVPFGKGKRDRSDGHPESNRMPTRVSGRSQAGGTPVDTGRDATHGRVMQSDSEPNAAQNRQNARRRSVRDGRPL